jgi:3D (Asp-Asp-Asp) domain-containing protein
VGIILEGGNMKNRIIIASVFVLFLGILAILNLQKTDSTTENVFLSTTTAISVETTNSTKTTKTTRKLSKKTTTTRITTKEGTYKLTHYGWDCKGCGGNTASGYNVRNTIYYNDATYGKLRIVAMKDLKLYSIIRIKNYDTEIYAIVLDRGVGSGVIDLLVENEKKASQLGIRKNIEIEVLRSGK